MPSSIEDIRKTGFESVKARLRLSPDTEYEIGKRKDNPLDTLVAAWDALPLIDLFHLQALTRTVAEELPGSKNDCRLLLNSKGKGDWSEVHVSTRPDIRCCVPISHIAAEFGSYEQSESVSTTTRVRLEGTATQQDGKTLNARHQLNDLEAMITSRLSAKIKGVVFGDIQDFAQAVADEVEAAKPELAKHLVVKTWVIDAYMRDKSCSTSSDQGGIATTSRCENSGSPRDDSHQGSNVQGAVSFKMAINNTDNANNDLQIEASPATEPGSTQASTLRHLMHGLDARLSSFSPYVSAEVASASTDPRTSPIDATIPLRGKMERGVFVALGSNVGNRIEEIEKACRAIDEDPDMRIVDTSFLYETKPMYVEDQERFVNGACEVSEGW